MRLKFGICFVVALGILSVNFGFAPTFAQSDVAVNCATEADRVLPFEGSLLLYRFQDDESRFMFVNSEGRTVDYLAAHSNFAPFYNPIDLNILFWKRTGDGPSRFSIDVWSLETLEILVDDLGVSDSYRPIQWLDNDQFLLSNLAENAFSILSSRTSAVQDEFFTQDFPDMRLIPIVIREDYDIAFSPDKQFIAYESEVIDRGIVVWDTETSEPIAEFDAVHGGLTIFNPVWSYNSEKLALALFVETEMQLFIFDARSGETTQVTMFETRLPEFGRPWGTIKAIVWSPNSRYVAFNGTLENSGLHILDVNDMTVTDVCIAKASIFWLPSGNFLVLYGSPIQILDVENNQIYTVSDVDAEPIGASPLSLDDLDQ